MLLPLPFNELSFNDFLTYWIPTWCLLIPDKLSCVQWRFSYSAWRNGCLICLIPPLTWGHSDKLGLCGAGHHASGLWVGQDSFTSGCSWASDGRQTHRILSGTWATSKEWLITSLLLFNPKFLGLPQEIVRGPWSSQGLYLWAYVSVVYLKITKCDSWGWSCVVPLIIIPVTYNSNKALQEPQGISIISYRT